MCIVLVQGWQLCRNSTVGTTAIELAVKLVASGWQLCRISTVGGTAIELAVNLVASVLVISLDIFNILYWKRYKALSLHHVTELTI